MIYYSHHAVRSCFYRTDYLLVFESFHDITNETKVGNNKNKVGKYCEFTENATQRTESQGESIFLSVMMDINGSSFLLA